MNTSWTQDTNEQHPNLATLVSPVNPAPLWATHNSPKVPQ